MSDLGISRMNPEWWIDRSLNHLTDSEIQEWTKHFETMLYSPKHKLAWSALTAEWIRRCNLQERKRINQLEGFYIEYIQDGIKKERLFKTYRGAKQWASRHGIPDAPIYSKATREEIKSVWD